MSLIRKISIGPDYKGGAMHYIVGQPVLNSTHVIHHISRKEETGVTEVWIKSDNGEVFLWKDFSSTIPISTEYSIDFGVLTSEEVHA